MLRLYIPQNNKKWFQRFFEFCARYNVELCIFPEGLRWRNGEGEGIIYKQAFLDYDFNYRRRLGKMPSYKIVREWFKKWKDLANLATEIPIRN